MNRQLTVMEERQKKQLADCKRISDARAEVKREVDTLRKELQNIVNVLSVTRPSHHDVVLLAGRDHGL